MKKLDSLTGVRGILAAMVVLVHGMRRTGYLDGDYPFVDGIRSLGHFGVVGFFVLSGFILSHVYRSKKWDVGDYVINRFARIYPLYLIGMVVAFPIDWLSPHYDTNNRLSALALSLPALQSWFSFSNGRFNSPGWTISVEFFFYAAFPLLLLIRTRSEKAFIFILSVVIFLTGLIWNPAEFLTSEKFPALRLWEFMLGMFIEPYVKKFHFNFRYGSIIALVLIFLGPFVGAYIGSLTRWDFSKWMSMSAISLIFICILCMGDLAFSSGRLFATKVCIIGGEISYSLYLIHDSIQRYSRVALEYFTGLSLQSMSWQIKLSYLAATTLLSLIASYALWKIVELPCRRFLRDFLSKKKLSSPSHLS